MESTSTKQDKRLEDKECDDSGHSEVFNRDYLQGKPIWERETKIRKAARQGHRLQNKGLLARAL